MSLMLYDPGAVEPLTASTQAALPRKSVMCKSPMGFKGSRFLELNNVWMGIMRIMCSLYFGNHFEMIKLLQHTERTLVSGCAS